MEITEPEGNLTLQELLVFVLFDKKPADRAKRGFHFPVNE